MNRTLTLRLMNTPGRAEIARQAVIALAVRAGMPPLAADRAGANVGSVVASCDGGDDGWRRDAAAALDAYGARAGDDGVALRLERTPLRPV